MTAPRVRMQKCPHCEAKCRVDDSRAVTRLVRDVYLSCTAPAEDCGFRFVSQTSVVRTLTPSRRPRPGVAIPFGVGRPAPAHMPVPANDSAFTSEPAPVELRA